MILDPNKDAFGAREIGTAHRQVASELVAASDGAIRLRWYRTHGEQFHAKMVAIRSATQLWFTLGSANLTRRNLDDYNLEANVIVEMRAAACSTRSFAAWFDTLWSNRGHRQHRVHRRRRRGTRTRRSCATAVPLMEATGLSTF